MVAFASLTAWAIKVRREVTGSARSNALAWRGRGAVSSVMAADMNDWLLGGQRLRGRRQLGIIMTNRHVVTSGLVTADAVFLNEEVDLTPAIADLHTSASSGTTRRSSSS